MTQESYCLLRNSEGVPASWRVSCRVERNARCSRERAWSTGRWGLIPCPCAVWSVADLPQEISGNPGRHAGSTLSLFTLPTLEVLRVTFPEKIGMWHNPRRMALDLVFFLKMYLFIWKSCRKGARHQSSICWFPPPTAARARDGAGCCQRQQLLRALPRQ